MCADSTQVESIPPPELVLVAQLGPRLNEEFHTFGVATHGSEVDCPIILVVAELQVGLCGDALVIGVDWPG